MKRALWIVLLAAILIVVVAPFAGTAKADGPYGSYGYVFPGSGYNRVCMYSAYNCVYRFVPPQPVSGWYYYPYNTWVRPYTPYNPYAGHYNPNQCTLGLYCGGGGGGYGW